MSARTRVFLVDDHPLVRDWLENLLKQKSDFVVCGQAEDAPSALSGMGKAKPDVAIVDLSLKSGSGLDLIKDIHASFPKIAVIVLSMHEETHYAERALRAGARGYVTKGESTLKIVDAIRQVLAGKFYANPEILERLAQQALGRGPGVQGSVSGLSDREMEVFQRMGKGQATRQIAADLKVSMKTVQAYCARIKDKLGLANGSELMREAVRWVEEERGA